jgi:transcriptional regulator with XRE-family HTH domain
MLTSTGRFLRKLRIDEGELLKDMAGKLHVTVSFLSAVENGKNRMPSEWNNRICELYHLSEEKSHEFTTAIAETEDTIEMSFIGQNLSNRELAVSFARKFSSIDDTQVEAIKKILTEGKKNDKLL